MIVVKACMRAKSVCWTVTVSPAYKASSHPLIISMTILLTYVLPYPQKYSSEQRLQKTKIQKYSGGQQVENANFESNHVSRPMNQKYSSEQEPSMTVSLYAKQ